MHSIPLFLYTKRLLFFCFLLLSNYKGNSQNIPIPEPIKYHPSIWLDAGLGAAGGGISIQYNLNAEIGNDWYMSIGKDIVWASFISRERFIDYTDVESISISLGKLVKSKISLSSFSLGLSYTSLDQNIVSAGNYLNRSNNVIGLTGKANILLGPGFLGIGVSPYFNINAKHSYFGFTLNLAVGSLHIRKKQYLNHLKPFLQF